MTDHASDPGEQLLPAESRGPRILMVEDEEPLRSVLSEYFVERGYNVESRESRIDAVTAFERRPPDVMIVDLDLGGDPMEGLDVARRTDHAIPVIFLAGHDDADTASAVRAAGAFDCLTKPFAFAQLRAIVDDALLSPDERRAISG